MRIVAGSARGRVLKAPKDAARIRPTADRVRETVFNVLGQHLDGLSVLDLFAGTGALGLEALSRGARSAVLVDSGREALGLCRENAAALGMSALAEVLAQSVESAVPSLGKAGRKFDLVFIDPPYALKVGASTAQAVAEAGLLETGGRVIVEHSKHEVLPERLGSLERRDVREFGETRVSIFSPVSVDP